ncbi:ASST-domain-containing protein [Xylariales sp. PMI_506]|nr:ASST-domain-containing protein [Xylariales sp. PMI_506]
MLAIHILSVFSALIGVGLCDAPLIYDMVGYNTGAYGWTPNQTYYTSNITSPLWQVNSWDQTQTDKTPYLMLALPQQWNGTANQGSGPYGPALFSSEDLSLVYSDPVWKLSKGQSVQLYKGIPYLVFFGGILVDNQHGNGSCYLVNSQYQIAHVISGVNAPQNADLHECLLTANGTALITSYYNKPYDLRPLDGPENGTLTDSMFQEIDIATGKLIFEWKAIEHYPLDYSLAVYAEQGNNSGLDWFHINSVQKTAEGHYLISSFGSGMISYINGQTGAPIWTLGGKGNNFTEPLHDNATTFLSHHARFRDADLTRVTFFNNAALKKGMNCTSSCSHGRLVVLNTTSMTAEIGRRYFHPFSIQAGPEGSYEVLSETGNVLVGWGASSTITEYNSTTGACVFNVQFGLFGIGPDNYRAFKVDWTGRPPWKPSIASDPNNIWVSWNGATEVKQWLLFSADSLQIATNGNWSASQIAGTMSKSGFETQIPVNITAPYARVSGVDATGVVLGSTDIIEIRTGRVIPATRPVGVTKI